MANTCSFAAKIIRETKLLAPAGLLAEGEDMLFSNQATDRCRALATYLAACGRCALTGQFIDQSSEECGLTEPQRSTVNQTMDIPPRYNPEPLQKLSSQPQLRIKPESPPL